MTHDGEVEVDASTVRRLVGAQFPELAHLPVTAVRSMGTVNDIYRIGDHLCARFPRTRTWSDDLEREWLWLPTLASRLSLRVPEPAGKGQPSSAYPMPWAIYRWIDGDTYDDALVDDEAQAARDLAHLVLELRGIDPSVDAPRAGRRPLRELDGATRAALSAADGDIDAPAALDAWSRAVRSPVWAGVPVWIHADLLRPNLLVRDGRLVAVLDFGGVGIGDPATDVIAAWSVLGPAGRAVFRDALDVDDATWARARGIALHQAAMIIPSYRGTSPEFAALAVRTVEQVLDDVRRTAG